MAAKTEATIEDLYHVPGHGKAELVNGELVIMSPTGFWPSRASGVIYESLRAHERKTKSGYALPNNAAFIVDLPNRRSFSPDAAWHTGKATGMRFLDGAPIFAAEVRSEDDYGAYAEKRMAAKRRDYFAAGTLCVWDVDLLSNDLIKSYHSSEPENPIIYRPSDVANAGEAVPGWSMPVDELLPDEE
jgi:Uma2 family endonuclease